MKKINMCFDWFLYLVRVFKYPIDALQVLADGGKKEIVRPGGQVQQEA
jgi:hypothetical protein